MDKKAKTVKKYFEAFKKGKVEEVLGYFAEDGEIQFGTEAPRQASDFYPETVEIVASVPLKMKGVFSSKDSKQKILHFTFDMPGEDGNMIEIDSIDLITFDNKDKIEKILMIQNA